jgi:hypothetical protein
MENCICCGLRSTRASSSRVVHETIKASGRSTGEGPRQRLRGALVIAEVAIALVLLSGAGLLMRSFASLQQVSPGFGPSGTHVAEIFLPRPKCTRSEQYVRFAEQTLGGHRHRAGRTGGSGGGQRPLFRPPPDPHDDRAPGRGRAAAGRSRAAGRELLPHHARLLSRPGHPPAPGPSLRRRRPQRHPFGDGAAARGHRGLRGHGPSPTGRARSGSGWPWARGQPRWSG